MHSTLMRRLILMMFMGGTTTHLLLAAQPDATNPTPTKLVVVTATREERVTWQTPSSVNVLDSRQIRLDQSARSLPQALANQPGTMIQKTSNGQGSPYLRGFTGFRTLMLIDGVRLNNSTFRDGPNQYWNTVDPLGVSRLESVRGPFAVQYGSDAVGGTVQAVTRGARDLRPDSTWDRRLTLRYADAEHAWATRAESIGRLTENLVLTLGGSGKSHGDIEGGDDVGSQPKTGYDERGWDGKLEYFAGADTRIVLAHEGIDQDDVWRTHKTIYGIDWKGLSPGDELQRVLDQQRRLTYLQVHHVDAGAVIEEIHGGLSLHSQDESQDRLRTRNRIDRQGVDVDTLGTFLSFVSPSPIGRWVYGTEYYGDTVDSFNHTLNPDGSLKQAAIQGPVADDATYRTLGLYVQNEASPGKRTTLLVGTRYEHAAADADTVQDPLTGDRTSLADNWDSVVGSARMLYALDPDQTVHLFAGVAQGFRAPNLSDLTRLDTARTLEIETPAPGLDPERFVSTEAGLKVQTRRLSVQLAVFHTDIRDLIVRVPTGQIIDGNREVTKRNAGDGALDGIEADAAWRLTDAWSCFGMFSWTEGDVETYPTSDPVLVKEPMDRIMPVTGRLGLRWDNGRCWAELAATMVADADRLSSSDQADTSRIPPGGTPGYTVCDARTGWRVTPDFTLAMAVENITDEDYRIHGSGVNEPGRNLVLTAEMVF